MNIRRLKFAYARGARIQALWFDGWFGISPNEWTKTEQSLTLRIHPDDDHLQYGPVSWALRESVIFGVTHPMFHLAMGMAVCLFKQLTVEWWDLTGDDRRMQWLFLAELLADEGL